MRGVFEQKSRRLTYQFRPMSQRQDQRPGILRPPLADRYGQVRRPEREGRGALAADRPWCRAARALGRDRSGVPSRGVNTGQRSPDGSDRRERQIRGGPGLAPGRSPRVRIIRMDDHVTTCRPLLPATSTTPRPYGLDRTAAAGGVSSPDRGGSAWIIAHWGWMPAREYTAFLQIGHIGLVEIGICRCLSATRFSPFGCRGSPRRRDARSDAPPPDDAWIDQ